MNMPLLTYIAEVSPRPMLLIAGSEAHSLYFTEDAYAAAAEPKELMIIDRADHVYLYDQVDISRLTGCSLSSKSAWARKTTSRNGSFPDADLRP